MLIIFLIRCQHENTLWVKHARTTRIKETMTIFSPNNLNFQRSKVMSMLISMYDDLCGFSLQVYLS